MGSTRTPGKSLADIWGKPLLSRLLDRLRLADLDGIILATTTNQEDDILEEWAKKEKIPCHRGSVEDVLTRTIDAHRKMGSDIVVRVCGDTPLIDYRMVNIGVAAIRSGKYDIAMAPRERNYPEGVSAHVCRLKDLEAIDTKDPVLREHVTLALYEKPGFRVLNFKGRKEWEIGHLRLQADYPDDLELIRLIHSRLGAMCLTEEIVSLVKREPWLKGMNSHCEERPIR